MPDKIISYITFTWQAIRHGIAWICSLCERFKPQITGENQGFIGKQFASYEEVSQELPSKIQSVDYANVSAIFSDGYKTKQTTFSEVYGLAKKEGKQPVFFCILGDGIPETGGCPLPSAIYLIYRQETSLVVMAENNTFEREGFDTSRGNQETGRHGKVHVEIPDQAGK